jgi:AraC-like DNA-binding protein
VPQLARRIGWSARHLGDEFRALTGCTVLEFVNRARMQRACALLLEPEARIFEVARRVGFTDSDHFTRLFHETTGMLPSAYRRLGRGRLPPSRSL